MAVFPQTSRKMHFTNSVRKKNNAIADSLCIDSYVKIQGIPEDIEEVDMSTVMQMYMHIGVVMKK